MRIPKIICTYSFKGGAGRTVCTANIAKFVAAEAKATVKNPLLLMDMDLDSAGLTVLLKQHTHFGDTKYNCAGLVRGDFALTDRDEERGCFNSGIVDVSSTVGAKPGTVRFMGTTVADRWSGAVLDKGNRDQLSDFLGICGEKGYTHLLVDSSSGFQETAHLWHGVADVIIYCCRLTEQFVYGTRERLRRLIKDSAESSMRIPAIIILPVAVPLVGEKWRAHYENTQTRFATMAGEVGHAAGDNGRARFIDDGIGEVESFKWLESILAAGKKLDAEDEIRALNCYRTVAQEAVALLDDRRDV